MHYLFHGEIKELSAIAMVAFWIKQVLVLTIVSILFYGSFIVNPKLKEIFARFNENTTPNPTDESEFFALRAKRKKWCNRCMWLGVAVLIVSPILHWL